MARILASSGAARHHCGMVPPADEPAEHLALAPIRNVPVLRPFRWLALGWRDFLRTPGASLFHGIIVAVGGWIILAITLRHWYLLPGAFSGFLLVGPILATGLYELSRRLERGERATLHEAIGAWRRGTRPLVWLGLILVLAGTGWVLVSTVLFALFVKAPITGLDSILRHLILSESSNLFPIWITLGGVGAALVFAVTVVSAPLLLDRDVDMTSAIVTSVRAVGENPIAMAVWATIIMVATGLAAVTLLAGFAIVIPVIGHATWHAYRDVVDAAGLPARAQ
jgi:uncharacterized membrane protein